MGKTSNKTGTQKKTDRYIQKEIKYEMERQKPYTKAARDSNKAISQGKGAPPVDLNKLTKQHEQAFKYAGKIANKQFAPIKEQAVSDYQRYGQPSAASNFAVGGSAVKQAMAESNESLARGLASDFAGMQGSIANNLLNQQGQNQQIGLNAKLGANAQLLNQSFNPQQSYSQAMQSPYNPSKGGTSGMGGQLLQGGLGALGSYASSGPGSAQIAGGISSLASWLGISSEEVKENIQDYDKGLDVIRDLEVKNYDYKIDVPGRKENRVGVIAEKVPEEIMVMIGDVKGVDVYGLVGLLINAVKELDKKVKELEAK